MWIHVEELGYMISLFLHCNGGGTEYRCTCSCICGLAGTFFSFFINFLFSNQQIEILTKVTFNCGLSTS